MHRISVDLSTSPDTTTMKPIEDLASGQAFPRPIAVDETYVFWATLDGNLRRMKLDGSEPTILAVAADDPDHDPHGITLDDSYVYWASWGACVNYNGCGGVPMKGRVQRISKTGGTKEILAEGRWLATSIVVDARAVYWTNWYAAPVMRLAL